MASTNIIRQLAGVLDQAEAENLPEVAALLKDALKLAAFSLAGTKTPPALTSLEMSVRGDPKMKIACIKSIRERTGLGLRESKDLYERSFPNPTKYEFQPDVDVGDMGGSSIPGRP